MTRRRHVAHHIRRPCLALFEGSRVLRLFLKPDRMEIDPIVLLAFGPPPDGINLEDDTKVKFTVTVLTLLFISALFLSVRIVVRAKQVYGLSLDDYAIIVSWVFVAATGAIVVVGELEIRLSWSMTNICSRSSWRWETCVGAHNRPGR